MGSKVFIIFLVLACLIAHTVSKQNATGDDNQLKADGDDKKGKATEDGNQLEANGDDNQLEANGDDNQVIAEPSAIDPVTLKKCCAMVVKPIVLTAKPRYKWIVVPPLSVT